MTTTDQGTGSPWRRRTGDLGDFVDKQVSRLARLYLCDTSQGVKSVARLAADAGRGVASSSLENMAWTIDGLQEDRFLPEGQASREEWASHAAITLFALHQRSLHDRSAHTHERTFAEAVGAMYRNSPQQDGILRRFNAAATAVSQDELLGHLRALVQLLKRERIGLDYGLLADDLLRMQTPNGMDRTRLDWGREFYRVRQPAPAAEDTTIDANAF